MKSIATLSLLGALLAQAQTPPPPVSPAVTQFFQAAADNLYTKLAARNAEAEDYDRAASATQLFFAYLAEPTPGYTPLLHQFDAAEVYPWALTLAQFQTVVGKGSIGLAAPPLTQAEITALVTAADYACEYGGIKAGFVQFGPVWFTNAVVSVLTAARTGKPHTVSQTTLGIAAQYTGETAYSITMNTLPGISYLTGDPGWADAMLKLSYAVAIIAEQQGASGKAIDRGTTSAGVVWGL